MNEDFQQLMDAVLSAAGNIVERIEALEGQDVDVRLTELRYVLQAARKTQKRLASAQEEMRNDIRIAKGTAELACADIQDLRERLEDLEGSLDEEEIDRSNEEAAKCRNCECWMRDGDLGANWGRCLMSLEHEREIRIRSYDTGGVSTRQDFGCVLFKEQL